MFYSVDSIVRSLLLKEGKSIHWYLQYLSYACAALQRLNTTTLKNINSKKLPVSNYKSVPTPCDSADIVSVGFEVGERVRPLIYDGSLNRLNNYDGTGEKIPFSSTLPDGSPIYNHNEPDDELGADDPLFNHDVSRDDYKYKVLPERGEIQLSADFPFQFVVVDFITDGLDSDAATRVPPLAQAAIEKYILWQATLHKRSAGEGEKMAAEKRFNDEWRLLRAASNPMTKADYIHAVRSGYSGTY